MSEGFTSGPWVMDYDELGCDLAITTDARMDDYVPICCMDVNFDPPFAEEQAANAHLIVAAPLLYDELSSAPEPNEIDVTNPERFKRIYREWFEASSKALAIARGELK